MDFLVILQTAAAIVLLSDKWQGAGSARRCLVCAHRLTGRGGYCSECGLKSSILASKSSLTTPMFLILILVGAVALVRILG